MYRIIYYEGAEKEQQVEVEKEPMFQYWDIVSPKVMYIMNHSEVVTIAVDKPFKINERGNNAWVTSI